MTTLEHITSTRYSCHICKKTYSTNSHLRRHETTHSGRLTAICSACNKQFSRLDAAHRHVQACCPDGPELTLFQPTRGKALQACDNCARRKLSCDAGHPCSRCAASRIECLYSRRKNKRQSSTGSAEHQDTSSTVSVDKTSEASPHEPVARIPIEFLLAFTTPLAHEATTTLIASGNKSLPTPPNLLSTDDDLVPVLNSDYYNMLFWDQTDWSTEFLDVFDQNSSGMLQHVMPTTNESQESWLSMRLKGIVKDLAATHAALLLADPGLHINFDTRKAERIFTIENLEIFAEAYFQRLNEFYSLLHRPSFDSETVSLPLLLAVFLFGSLSSPKSEAALQTREFFDISEEYIFNHLAMQLGHQKSLHSGTRDTDVEFFQAALIMEIVQNGTNNEATRKRLRLVRHPHLVANMRRHGLFSDSSGRDSDMVANGQASIACELQIRLANMTFVLDSCFSIMFNSCPLMNVSDMNIGIPCSDKAWEAKTEEEFNLLQCSELYEPTSRTTLQLVQDLIRDSWNSSTYEQATATQLGLAICAVQSMTMMMRYSLQLQTASSTITRALDRWEALWNHVVASHHSEHDFLRGFNKHNLELSEFVRTLIRVDSVGDSDLRYMEVVPTDEIKHLHEFLKKYNAR